jgi:hypothetical protein
MFSLACIAQERGIRRAKSKAKKRAALEESVAVPKAKARPTRRGDREDVEDPEDLDDPFDV